MNVKTAGLFGLALTAAASAAAAQDLVADINQQPSPFTPGADPAGTTSAGGRLYFAASTALHGKELWVLDTPEATPRLVADLAPGASASAPGQFVELPDGDVVFAASRPDVGTELWRTDGTEAGTQLVADIQPGATGAFPWGLVRFGDAVYFWADDGVHGMELWRSDGTAAGTSMVAEVHVGPKGASESWLAPAIGVSDAGLLFSARDFSGNGWVLWGSDGTAARTKPLVPLANGSFEPVEEYARLGSSLVFTARDANLGRQPWISDGTAAGTLVLEVPGSAGDSQAAHYVAVGDEVFFSAFSSNLGTELWKTDGTVAGTQLVADIAQGGIFFGSSTPVPFAAFGDECLFTANDFATGNELWASDGTAAGTRLVVDLNPGPSGSQSSLFGPQFAVVGDEVFFVANGPTGGSEIHRTDGTAAGTFLVEDIYPGPFPSHARELAAFGGELFATADDGIHGYELWRAPSASGAHLVADVFPADDSVGSDPTWLTRFLGDAIFVADDGVTGAELWRTDGTPEGTTQFLDFVEGPVSSRPLSPQQFGDKLFVILADEEHGAEPRITDGTIAGTVLLADIIEGPADSVWGGVKTVLFDGKLFFSALGEMWITDGTPAGTFPFDEDEPGVFSLDPSGPIGVFGDELLFFRSTEDEGAELHRMNAAGEFELVVDANPGREGSIGNIDSVGTTPNGLVFPGTNGVDGFEPWVSDGTAGGTTWLGDIAAGSASSNPIEFRDLGDVTLFLANGEAGVRQLFATDGTLGGTLQLGSFPGGVVRGVTPNGDHALFLVNREGGGLDLWRTDATVEGTELVVTLTTSGFPVDAIAMSRAASGDTVLFAHDDGVHGEELWRTDGTADGTMLLADLNALGAYAYPKDFLRVGNRVLFTADGGPMGTELFSVELEHLEEFVAEPFGDPCGTATTLTADGAPVADQPFDLEVQASGPGLIGVLTAGGGQTFLPLGPDCAALVELPWWATIPFVSDADGRFSLPVSLGANSVGVEIALQAFVLEPSALAASQGLELVVGP